jgi:hypothetical protein
MSEHEEGGVTEVTSDSSSVHDHFVHYALVVQFVCTGLCKLRLLDLHQVNLRGRQGQHES